MIDNRPTADNRGDPVLACDSGSFAINYLFIPIDTKSFLVLLPRNSRATVVGFLAFYSF